MELDQKKLGAYFDRFNAEFEDIRRKEEILSKGLGYKQPLKVNTLNIRTICESVYQLKAHIPVRTWNNGRKSADLDYFNIYKSAVNFCKIVFDNFLVDGEVPEVNAKDIVGYVNEKGDNEQWRLMNYCKQVSNRFDQETERLEELLMAG